MSLLCRVGIHARYRAPHGGSVGWLLVRLYWCRRCPGQWRIGSYGYSWGTVRYHERIEDRT